MPTPEAHFLEARSPSPLTTVEVENVASHSHAGGEHIPNEPAGIGRMAIAAVAELPETPGVDVERQEAERKMNTAKNLRALQSRFGERFVKGDLMEGGGYTGGAARELLAGFMDRPGFADELKRLIPGKRGALALLKDNHAYIQATLEQRRYKDDSGHERQPIKDPYELARSVGYELTGPFESPDEFVSLDGQDFRPSERLCTFNSPAERLKDYNILWLRHAEVADTLPADELTADTLSEAWKTYLKTIGRYDRNSDSYDLAGLRPTRDDPYGTSSMSVQISRRGTHVSIKNRYNHTVGNPDNTLDSNLDHVAYGLKRAVYSRVGREELMDKTSVALAEGYVADDDGGIHHYRYEEDNVYYGDYEYVSNGVVTTIDRGRYYMISPQLYTPRSGKGDELRLGRRSVSLTGIEVPSDVRFLYKSSTNGKEKDPHIVELRQAYAERDHAELKVRTVEYVREQVGSAYAAYKAVADQLLGTKRDLLGGREVAASVQDLEQLFAAKDKEWQVNGVYDYLVEKLIADGARFHLVATPNLEVSEQQIVALAEAFGKGQPYQTYVYDELYRKGRYTGREWSGNSGNAPVRLSLIPSKVDAEISNRTVDDQVRLLRDRQTGRPSLQVRVPSLLDAVTYWHALRAQGDKLDDSSAFDKTYIRHFDLDPKVVDTWSIVPRSFMRRDGRPGLDGSSTGDGSDARVAVG
jgi:hypothetical protein